MSKDTDDELQEGMNCPECKEGFVVYQEQEDGSCSCHTNPPCSYCTDKQLTCSRCGEVFEEALTTPPSTSTTWKPTPFEPKPCGDGMITKYDYDSSSGSTMVFTGTFTGEVTNDDLLEFFGTGSWGYRFGYCNGGRFKFTKVTG